MPFEALGYQINTGSRDTDILNYQISSERILYLSCLSASGSKLFHRNAVVEHKRAVEEQHITVVKVYEVSKHIA